MVSNPNPLGVNVSQGEGEGADPLTPIERMILDLLLKKQAGVNVAAEVQSSCSVAKVENVADVLPVPARSKAQETKPVGRKPESEDDTSGLGDGPLDDEELEKLMREYDFDPDGLGESEEEESSETDTEMAYKQPLLGGGRGRGDRGSKTNRGGRGTRRGRAARDPSPMFGEDMIGDDTDTDEDEMEMNENDPATIGLTYMEKMSDSQVIQYLDTYKAEKKMTPDAKFDNNDFLIWLANKMKSMNPAPPAPPVTQGKKVTFQVPPTSRGKGGGPRNRGGGGRGSRGGRKGGSRRMDGYDQL